MEKIDFVNNDIPALNARTLNKLQDNIEDAIEEQAFDDVTLEHLSVEDLEANTITSKRGNIVVDSIRSKNKFGGYGTLNGLFINAGTYTLGSNSNATCVYIPIKTNTTYTVSKTKGNRFAIGFSNTTPVANTALTGVEDDRTAPSLTSTSANDSKYLIIYISLSDTETFDNIVATIQVEEGDTATTFSKSQSLNGENYTTGEQVVGTWLGKPLYRKVITRTVNANTNDSVALSTLGISNQDAVIINVGMSTAHYQMSTIGGGYAPIIYYVSNTDKAHVYLGGNKELQIQNQNNSQREYNIVLEYTKTTEVPSLLMATPLSDEENE